MKQIISKIKLVCLLVSIFIFFSVLPYVSLAADIYFNTNNNNNIFSQNEDFLVQVFLDSTEVKVNALEGTVVFPPELLVLKEIRDGNSAINFWIKKPESLSDGVVSFSGITTGGFSGEKRFLFGMVFQTKKIGSGKLSFNGLKVLQNDGLATKIAVKETLFDFSISLEGGSRPEDLKIKDNAPPEIFYPSVAEDSTIFDGKYFLVFSTVDKGSGVDHYEVREGFWGKYITAKSPYLLKDQSLSSNIYIKAVDKAGNERRVEIKAQNLVFLLELGFILGIILIIAIFLSKKIWLKHTER